MDRRPRRTGRGGGWLWIAASLSACAPTAKQLENAQIHYDLGVNAMELSHDAQSAVKEFQTALKENPNDAEAEDGLGLALHLMLHRPEEAVPHYLHALEIDPKFSEAANNLGNAYTDLGRYADAARMYRRALSDEMYRTPYIAEGNLGWVLYKSGEVEEGIRHLKTAIAENRSYCQGYRSLGMIDAQEGKLGEAEEEFTAFRDHCPQVPEARYRLGLVLLKEGRQDRAREEFSACAAAKAARDTDLGAECARLVKMME